MPSLEDMRRWLRGESVDGLPDPYGSEREVTATPSPIGSAKLMSAMDPGRPLGTITPLKFDFKVTHGFERETHAVECLDSWCREGDDFQLNEAAIDILKRGLSNGGLDPALVANLRPGKIEIDRDIADMTYNVSIEVQLWRDA